MRYKMTSKKNILYSIRNPQIWMSKALKSHKNLMIYNYLKKRNNKITTEWKVFSIWCWISHSAPLIIQYRSLCLRDRMREGTLLTPLNWPITFVQQCSLYSFAFFITLSRISSRSLKKSASPILSDAWLACYVTCPIYWASNSFHFLWLQLYSWRVPSTQLS